MKAILISFIAILFVFPSFSAEKEGVTVPDKVTIAKEDLVLNGMGVRRGTLFNFKVYVGSLYLKRKTKKAQQVISQDFPKQIRMNFLRDVDKESLNEAWKEGFEAAVPKDQRKLLREEFNSFLGTMDNVRKKEAIFINFLEKGVEVIFKDKKHPLIKSQAFSKALLSIWFINARDEDLRDGLLGKL